MAGPFYFAYVDPGTAFNAAVHNVFDETVFSFKIEHSEGDFPALELTIKNPRVGLLAPDRKRWAWLSWDKAAPAGPADIVPLFFGRIVGIPNDLHLEEITLSFLARPADYDEQKAAVAETKKVAPYWDPIWFAPEKLNDPDNVLESRSELWHIDRVTHVVTTSDIINGEDGTLTFDESEVFYETMSITYGETPLRTIRMAATIDWDMTATASFDISGKFAFGGFGVIKTFTGKGLVENWPKSGASLGNGWTVEAGFATRVDGQGPNIYYTNQAPVNPAEFELPFQYRPPFDPEQPKVTFSHDFEYAPKFFVPYYLKNWKTQGQDPIAVILRVVRWRIRPAMRVRYNVSRKYTENLSIEITADVQDILTDAGGEDVLDLKMSSSEVASPIDPAGALPIGDVRRRTYFSQTRGAQSIEYLITLMRARLLVRARTVYVTFPISFREAVERGMSCRKNSGFSDPRLPGGIVAGKITHYEMALDGASGEATCEITIGCTIGKGGAVTPTAGDPDYAAPGYMAPGYQCMNDEIVMPVAGEVTYKSIIGLPPNDDGVDLLTLDNQNVIKTLIKQHGWAEQEIAMATDPELGVVYGSNGEPNDIFERLKGLDTKFTLVMRPVTGGPFLTEFDVEASELKIPKTIDLEAS